MKIEKCPFCGGEAIMRERFIHGSANTKHYRLECKDCHASFLNWNKNTSKAIAAWNSRTGKDINVATNADRIRAMSDEGLARALHQAYADGMCDMVRAQRDIGTHVNTIMYYRNWLQQPAKEEV